MHRFGSAVLFALTVGCGGKEFASGDASVVGPDASSTTTGAAGQGGTTAAGVGGNGGAVGGNGGSSGAGGGGRDAGAPKNSGDCNSAGDCGGEACLELAPGGFRICVTKVPDAVQCSMPGGVCCKSSECATAKGERCVLGPIQPACGGAFLVPTNVCVSDKCKTNTDCPGANSICAPAGTFGRKEAGCIAGGCRFDRDCTAEPNGRCVTVANACCPTIPVGLYCVYEASGCRTDANCPGGHCEIVGNRTRCAPGGAVCPASMQ